MSLKIRIGKQSLTSESRPTKRRIQRIESEDEDDVDEPSYGASAEGSQRKKLRTAGRSAPRGSRDDDYAEDVDVDIDGDIEDTRFLPDPPPSASRSISPAAGAKRKLSTSAASSSKARSKESKLSKSKSSTKKPRRQVVWTDDEDEEFADPEVVVTNDEDFDSEPDYSSSKKGGKAKGAKTGSGKAGTKGKPGKEKDDKEITFRDERKLAVLPPEPPKRPSEPVRSSSALGVDPSVDLNIPVKRKLPTIKKNKPSTASSTAPSTPSATKTATGATGDKKETLTPALTSNQVGSRKPAGASADLNLLDSSVYSELFKSKPGAATPNSGLNRKQKEEERRRELNRMRDEARAKREAEAKNSFDLQAAPEKIERFVLLRLRHSTARYPHVLGAAFKALAEANPPA